MLQNTVKKQKDNPFLKITFFLSVIYIFFWENIYVVNSNLLLFIVAAFALLAIMFSEKIKVNKSNVFFFLIILHSLISTLYTVAPFEEASRWTMTVVIVFIVGLAFQNSRINPKVVLKVFLVCSSVFLFGIYLQLMSPGRVFAINSSFLKSGSLASNLQLYEFGYYCGFSGFNFISALFCALLMMVLLSIVFCARKSRIKSFAMFFFAILSFVAIIIAQKRGVFIAALVSLISFALIFNGNKKVTGTFLRIVLVLLVFLTVTYVFLQNSESGQLFLERFDSSDGDITSGRNAISETLLEDFWDYCLLGNGSGSVFVEFDGGAHNIYLHLLYEGGIIGLILYLCYFIINLSRVYKIYNSYIWTGAKKAFLLASLSFQVVFLVYGFFGNPISDVFVFLLYSIIASIPYSKTFSEEISINTQRAKEGLS